MLFNYCLIVQYDGTNFFGFQSQKKERNVQDELEKAIIRLNSSVFLRVQPSGRTDAKVHALGQVVTFQSEKDFDKDYFLFSINRLLPDDIYVKDFKKVDLDFHPRYFAKGKHYQYRTNLGEYNVFKANYELQYNKQLDLMAMQQASTCLLGKQDYRTFSSATVSQDSVKDIFKIDFKVEDNILIIDFYGSGFLRYMVRKLVRILLDVGEGKKTKADIQALLAKKDISAYSKIAPGCGLYLMEVYY